MSHVNRLIIQQASDHQISSMQHFTTLVLAALASLALAKSPPAPTTCEHPPKDSPSDKCTKTTCTDIINDCGKTYGGCYKNCEGHTPPTFADPGCPSSSSGPIVTDNPVPNDEDCPKSCDKTMCADYVNDCGKWSVLNVLRDCYSKILIPHVGTAAASRLYV